MNNQSIRYVVHITSREELGSRRDMVAALIERSARNRRKKLALWIGDPKKTQLKRRELLKRLSYHPSTVPFRTKLLHEEMLDTYVRRTYRMQINPDDQTEAVLYLPRHASSRNPVPVILGLHEHGGQFLLGKDKICNVSSLPAVFHRYQAHCYGGQMPADFFASKGFAVFAIDQIEFGSRALWQKEDEPYRKDWKKLTPAIEEKIRHRMRYEQFWLHRALLSCGVTEAEISLYDNRRSLDFLETVPEIDSRRIGVFGLSLGAMQCHQLAAFDSRVRASVRICWSGDLEMMLKANGPRGLGVNFLLPYFNKECHVPELVALSDPSAVLIINGKKDSLYPLQAQEKTRREVLKVALRQDRIQTVRWHYFDGPHCFYPLEQQKALEFFQEFL